MNTVDRMRDDELDPWDTFIDQAGPPNTNPAVRPRDTRVVIPDASQLATLPRYGGGRVPLLRSAAEAYGRLLAAARQAGIRPPLLEIVSGYRTVEQQKVLYEGAQSKYHEAASKWVAPPGKSVHQSGRAIDFFMGIKNKSANVSRQRNTAVYRWLTENADRFDFVPYQAEPWHWEYTPRTASSSAPHYVLYPREVRVGGTVAWRNNNPGNIVFSRQARAYGAIGRSGRFAVFPDENTGMRAVGALLRSSHYRNLSIRDGMRRYAPAEDHNDPVAYARWIGRETGIDAARTFGSLTDSELAAVVRAIRKVEGWRPGTSYTCDTRAAPDWAAALLRCEVRPASPTGPTGPAAGSTGRAGPTGHASRTSTAGPTAAAGPRAPEVNGTPGLATVETSPPERTLYVNIPLGNYLSARTKGTRQPIPALTGIYVPAGLSAASPVDVLIYLHGHHPGAPNQTIAQYWSAQKPWPLREGVHDSGKRAILVAPTLGPWAEAGWLGGPGGLDRYMELVRSALAVHGPYRGTRPAVGRLILACHSGGGTTMRRFAMSPGVYAGRVVEVWGFDCLYNQGDETAWAQWARARPTARVYVYYLGSTATRSRLLGQQGVPNVHVERSTAANHDHVPIKHWGLRLGESPLADVGAVGPSAHLDGATMSGAASAFSL
jgi:hypothetical protein